MDLAIDISAAIVKHAHNEVARYPDLLMFSREQVVELMHQAGVHGVKLGGMFVVSEMEKVVTLRRMKGDLK